MDRRSWAAIAGAVILLNALALGAPFAVRALRDGGQPGPAGAAKIHVDVSVRKYSVRGSTVAELEEAMGRNGPGRRWGSTFYRMEPDYEPRLFPDGSCAVGSAAISFKAIVRVPELGWFHGADVCLAGRFAAMADALLAHEQQHVALGLEAAAAIAAVLGKMPPATTCERLRAEVDGLFREVNDEYNRRQLEFDARTSHGVKDGVVILPCP